MDSIAKYVLITGGTSGIGYELARIFARNHYRLILVARSSDELEKCAAEFRKQGTEVITITKDLFEPEAAFEVYSEVKAGNIVVDVLVNNAGQGEYGKFVDTDLEKELKIIQLNVAALVVLTKLFMMEMVRYGSGRILNLSSIASKVPDPYQAVYHGTKAFVHSFTEAIRSETQDTGVTITSLLPGATDTDFFHKAHMESSKVVQADDLDNPEKVAKDGYEALMEGKDMVISGFKNKMQAVMSSVLPDHKMADSMGKAQKPADETKHE